MALHPPKVEVFDVVAGTNTDPKGFVRPVELYREAEGALHLSRPMIDHPTLAHLRSWLVPALGLRITDFTFHPGYERTQDWYLDVVDITRDGGRWYTEDHYLDLVVHTGERTDLLDVDEYVEAVAHGLLCAPAAERALHTSHRAMAGLAAHGHDLDAWLGSVGVVRHLP